MLIDARIPVAFGIQAGDTDALLVPDGAATGHSQGCACCLARGPAAAAFDSLFLDRVHGTVPWFTRVVIAQDDRAVRDTVLHDPVVATRFRLA